MGRVTPRTQPIELLMRHRQLLWRVARSDLKATYAGAVFGTGWAILTPLILLAIYAVVYLMIFKVRAPGMGPLHYVLYIFSGLVPFLMTADAMSNGTGSVVVNKSIWANTVFPVDLAPAKAVLLSQIPMVVGLAVILGAVILTGNFSWTFLLLPVVWGLHLMLLIGLTWFLSMVNVVLRDARNVVGLLIMALMILSPIAYTPDMVPPQLKVLLLLNPLAYYVSAYQSILVLGCLPTWWHWIILTLMSFSVFYLGNWFFGRAKQALIDYV